MFNFILLIIIAIICVESITNILSKSQFFEFLREFLRRHNTFLFDLINCPYCLSCWIGMFMSCMLWLYYVELLLLPAEIFFIGLALHRLSNILHHLIDRAGSYYFEEEEDNELPHEKA